MTPRPSPADPPSNSAPPVAASPAQPHGEAFAMRRHAGIVTRSFSAAAVRPSPHAAPLPPVVATSAPTPQFRQHHRIEAPQVDATAFRQGWRVATRLDALLEADRIDREAWDGAHEFRRWTELIGLSHVQLWDVGPDAPCHRSDLPMLRRMEAAARLRACTEALGQLRMRLLDCCVVRDLSWREIAALLRASDKTATAWVVEALFALTGAPGVRSLRRLFSGIGSSRAGSDLSPQRPSDEDRLSAASGRVGLGCCGRRSPPRFRPSYCTCQWCVSSWCAVSWSRSPR
jgi:hypothetical protein